MTMASQSDIVRRHVEEAESAGGRIVRGDADESLYPHQNYLSPTVLLDVPEDNVAIWEETFGPTLSITKVRDAEEALELTNTSAHGRGGSVFTKSKERGLDLARRMRSGMTSINSVLTFASVPALPFGGVGDSGFGRIHGEDGLKEFTRAKSITRQRVALPVNLMSFERPASATDALARVMGIIHGSKR
jgi:aldehyde dehydrogenase (NAD+)